MFTGFVEGFINEMPNIGWALLYLVIGWVLIVVDIVRHFVKDEGEIALRIVAWPIILFAKTLMLFFSVVGIAMRATERLGTSIREFDDKMGKGP